MDNPPFEFLCQLKANRFALQFLQLKVKNPENGVELVDVKMDENANEDLLINDEDYSDEML